MSSEASKSKKQLTAVDLARKIQEIRGRRQKALTQIEELQDEIKKVERLNQLQEQVKKIDEELDALLQDVVVCV